MKHDETKMTFDSCADVHTTRSRQVLSHAHMCAGGKCDVQCEIPLGLTELRKMCVRQGVLSTEIRRSASLFSVVIPVATTLNDHNYTFKMASMVPRTRPDFLTIVMGNRSSFLEPLPSTEFQVRTTKDSLPENAPPSPCMPTGFVR